LQHVYAPARMRRIKPYSRKKSSIRYRYPATGTINVAAVFYGLRIEGRIYIGIYYPTSRYVTRGAASCYVRARFQLIIF
jgi:hypothetical protein